MSKRPIIIAVDDMFFAAKIRATGEALDIPLRFVRKPEEIIFAARAENPSLIIFDLHSKAIDPFAVARELKEDARLHDIRLLGFFSHVRTELQQRARESGFDQIMPRSAFSKRLAEILQA